MKEETNMKIPKTVQKAVETLVGYCNKHKSCESCPLARFCAEEIGVTPMCNWEIKPEET